MKLDELKHPILKYQKSNRHSKNRKTRADRNYFAFTETQQFIFNTIYDEIISNERNNLKDVNKNKPSYGLIAKLLTFANQEEFKHIFKHEWFSQKIEKDKDRRTCIISTLCRRYVKNKHVPKLLGGDPLKTRKNASLVLRLVRKTSSDEKIMNADEKIKVCETVEKLFDTYNRQQDPKKKFHKNRINLTQIIRISSESATLPFHIYETIQKDSSARVIYQKAATFYNCNTLFDFFRYKCCVVDLYDCVEKIMPTHTRSFEEFEFVLKSIIATI